MNTGICSQSIADFVILRFWGINLCQDKKLDIQQMSFMNNFMV